MNTRLLFFLFTLLVTCPKSTLCQLISLSTNDEHLVKEIKKFDGAVLSLDYNKEGTKIITGEESGIVKIWNLEDDAIEYEITAHYRPVRYVCFSGINPVIYTAGDKTIRQWNIGEDKSIQTFSGHVTDVMSVGLTKNEKTMVTGSFEKQVHFWKTNIDKEPIDIEGHKKSVFATDISPDGKSIVSGDLLGVLKIWNGDSFEELYSIEAHGDAIMDVDITADGKYFASGSNDNNIKLWDIKSGKLKKVYTGHNLGVLCIDISPDGNYLLSGSTDMTINLYEIVTGNKLYTFTGHENVVNQVKWHPTKMEFASVSADGTLKIWNITKDIFVNYYFEADIIEEMEESDLFLTKQRGESREDYSIREAKAAKYKQELFEKYYNRYLEMVDERKF